MKLLQILTATLVISFAAGCQQKDQNQGATSDTSTRSSGAARYNMPRDSTEPGNAENKPADRASDALIPSDQGGSEPDRELTRRIRRVITQNDQLSAAAKNIRITTVNGKVTLRGPVKNEGEAKAIADVAESIAGVGSVDNQLDTKANSP